MNIENRVTILGCGHGGMALAADLKLKGVNVALWSDPNHAAKFNKIVAKNGQITLHDGDIINIIKIDLISHNLSEVLNYSDIIYNCTPMSAHALLFEKVALTLYKTTKTKLFINVSGAFSGAEQYIKTNNKTIFNKIKIFDTATFPYACRVNKGNSVSILGRKSEISIAPLFSSNTYYLDFLMQSMQPTHLNIVENAFKLGLMATNAVWTASEYLWVVCFLFRIMTSFLYTSMNSLLYISLHKDDIPNASNIGAIIQQFSIGLGVVLAVGGFNLLHPSRCYFKFADDFKKICTLLAVIMIFNLIVLAIFYLHKKRFLFIYKKGIYDTSLS